MPGRVLIVDDNNTVRKIIRLVLEEAGYGVVGAIDGQQALEIVQRDTFDLALIDFVMPKLNGYQLAQAIRSISHLRELPIVLMSAKAEQIGERFMRQTGAIDAITKPFAPDAILAVIAHALAKRDGGDTASTLVRDEMRSQSLMPPSPSEPPVSVTQTDAKPFHLLPKNTIPDLHDVAPMLTAQIAATERLASSLARLVMPALAELGFDTSLLDSRAMADAIARAAVPSELVALAADVRTFDADLRGPIVLEGSVAAVPLGEVLQLVRLQRQTGLLVVQRKDSEVVVAFRLGSIELALARGVSSEFLLGRYLIADRAITREALDRALAARGEGGWLGARLVKQNVITAEVLERALTRQSSEIIYEMLRWNDGRYRFEQGVVLPEAQNARLDLPVESLVLEGFRRVDEWRVIEQEVSSFDDVLARDESAIDSVGARIAKDEQAILDAVDGRRTVREVLNASAVSSFDGCRVIYRLLRSRLVRRRAA